VKKRSKKKRKKKEGRKESTEEHERQFIVWTFPRRVFGKWPSVIRTRECSPIYIPASRPWRAKERVSPPILHVVKNISAERNKMDFKVDFHPHRIDSN
jgi:hypothetical protein